MSYSNIFDLDVIEDDWNNTDDSIQNGPLALQRLRSEQTLLEEQIYRADPRCVTVTFVHGSIFDFIRDPEQQPIQAGNDDRRIVALGPAWANQTIARCCMKVMTDEETRQRFAEFDHVYNYATRHWLSHLLAGLPLDSVAPHNHNSFIRMLCDTLTSEKPISMWMSDIDHLSLSYDAAEKLQAVLTHPDAEPFFKGAPKPIQKWRKKMQDKPLVVFEFAIAHCCRVWLQVSPPHPLGMRYASVAISYFLASRAKPTSEEYCNWIANADFIGQTPNDVLGAAKMHFPWTDRKALWSCRVAAAYSMTGNDGERKALKEFKSIKSKSARWEARLGMARLYSANGTPEKAVVAAKQAIDSFSVAFDTCTTHWPVWESHRLIAHCLRQRMKTLSSSDCTYNQIVTDVAVHLKQAVLLDPFDSQALIEHTTVLHEIALRLMVEGYGIDADGFFESEGDDYTSSEESVSSHNSSPREDRDVERDYASPVTSPDLSLRSMGQSTFEKRVSASSETWNAGPLASEEKLERIPSYDDDQMAASKLSSRDTESLEEEFDDDPEFGLSPYQSLSSSSRIYLDTYNVSSGGITTEAMLTLSRRTLEQTFATEKSSHCCKT